LEKLHPNHIPAFYLFFCFFAYRLSLAAFNLPLLTSRFLFVFYFKPSIFSSIQGTKK